MKNPQRDAAFSPSVHIVSLIFRIRFATLGGKQAFTQLILELD